MNVFLFSRRVFSLFFLSLVCSQSIAQHDSSASSLIADILFESRAKPVRRALKQFEQSSGFRLSFRVGDASIDSLGGLSEHLLKLFQDLSAPNPHAARSLCGEFSVDAASMMYASRTSADISQCFTPNELNAIDVQTNSKFQTEAMSARDYDEAPEMLHDFFPQQISQYHKLSSKNGKCSGHYDPQEYGAQVAASGADRALKWSEDVSAIRAALSNAMLLLSTESAVPGSQIRLSGGTPHSSHFPAHSRTFSGSSST